MKSTPDSSFGASSAPGHPRWARWSAARRAQDGSMTDVAHAPGNPTAARLAALAVPAIAVGVGCAVTLIALSTVAARLQDLLWTVLPESLGVATESRWWTFGMLTEVGVAVGLVVWKVPGHAGPDPATTGLVGAPLPLAVLPSLAVAIVLGLAGGVSL